MTRKERTRYEALVRVRGFGAAHRELFPESSLGGQALAEVGAAVEAFDTHATAKLAAAKDGRREKAVARAAVKAAMRTISRNARSVRPQLRKGQNPFVMPDRRSDAALLHAADNFANAAEADPARFIALGLPPTFVADLRQAIASLEKAVDERNDGRRAVTDAQSSMTAALARGAVALATLDAVVINLVGKDPGLSAAWDRDRRVVGDKARKTRASVAAKATIMKEDSPNDPLKKVS